VNKLHDSSQEILISL